MLFIELAGRLAGWAGFSSIFIDFDGFSRIWCHSAPKPGTPPMKRPVAHIKTFAPSWLAGFSWIFIDFDGFLMIWCQKVPEPGRTWWQPMVQAAAPIETFAPSWLAGFSWIFIDFDGFSRIWCHSAPKPGTPPMERSVAPYKNLCS